MQHKYIICVHSCIVHAFFISKMHDFNEKHEYIKPRYSDLNNEIFCVLWLLIVDVLVDVQ
jgi:hypothetical protein